jgi:sortase B
MSRKRKDAASAFGPVPEEALDFSVNPGDRNASDPLLHSLDRMTEKDIAPSSHSRQKPQKRKGGVVRNVILVISLIVFVGCAIWLVDNLIQKKKAVDETNELRTSFSGNSFAQDGEVEEYDPGNGAIVRLHKAASAQRVLCLTDRIALNNNPVSGVSDKDVASMLAAISGLGAQYPDLYGWITVPNTHIDHPVMQSDDNEWYLDHSYKGTYLVTGSIFADYRCSRTILRNFNTVLYGHNITTGDMFHDVTKFLDEDFFNSTKIYVYTMDGVYIYEPFAIFEAASDFNYFRTEFANDEEFIKFAREMRDTSVFKRDIDFKSTDRILTLSTCTNGAQTQRWCLQARLVQVIT